MTTLRLLATTLLVASLAVTPLTALAGNGKGNGGRPATAGASTTALVPLTLDEIDTLLWMREEEKLARDVYIKMTEKYTAEIFSNIAAAEQKHFDAIGRKLALYGIPDVALPAVGAFYDKDLQKLYDDLVKDGLVGYVEARRHRRDRQPAAQEDLFPPADRFAAPPR